MQYVIHQVCALNVGTENNFPTCANTTKGMCKHALRMTILHQFYAITYLSSTSPKVQLWSVLKQYGNC